MYLAFPASRVVRRHPLNNNNNTLVIVFELTLLFRHFPFPAPLLGKDRYARMMEERTRQAEEDRIVKEEADKKKKEEQEQKKKEADQKKKEMEEKKKEEMAALELEKKGKKKLAEVVFASVDAALKPVEEAMDSVLGHTIDPFTGIMGCLSKSRSGDLMDPAGRLATSALLVTVGDYVRNIKQESTTICNITTICILEVNVLFI